MAASNTVALTYTAELKDLKKKLASIPDITGAEARKAVKELNKAIRAAGNVQSKAGKAAARAARNAARAAEESARATKEGFKGVIELGGLSGDKLEKVNAAMAALATPAGAFTVAISAGTLAVAGLAAGMVKAVTEAERLADELEGIRDLEGFGIAPAALESLQRANRSIEGIGAVAKQTVVILGAELAPAVEQAARVVLKFGLIGLDVFNAYAKGGDLLRDLANFMSRQLVGAFTRNAQVMVDTIGLVGEFAAAVGADGLAGTLRGVTKRWKEFTEVPASLALGAAGLAIGELDALTGDYDGRVKEIVGTLQKLKDAEEDGGEAAKALAEAQKLANSERAKLIKLAQKQIEAESALAGVVRDIETAQLSGAEAATRAVEDLYDRRLTAIGKVADVTGETASILAATDAALLERQRGLTAILDTQAEEAERVAAAMRDVDTAVGKLPSRFEIVAAGAAASFNAIGEAVGKVTGAISSITGGAIDLSVGGLIDAVAGDDPQSAKKMIRQATQFVDALVKRLPVFLDALIAGMPKLVRGIIQALPELIEALVSKLPVLAIKLALGIIGNLIANLPELIKALAVGIGKAIRDGLMSIVDFFRDVFREIKTLGKAKTKTFGDTPGPVRVPPEGLSATFAPGDIVVAARTPEGVQSQAQSLPVPRAPRAMASAVAAPGALRLQDGHLFFEAGFRRNAMNGGTLAGIGGRATGRLAVFNRGQ